MTYFVNGGAVSISADGVASYSGSLPSYIGYYPVLFAPVSPDIGAAGQEKPEVFAAKFGDGYQQTTPVGLNNTEMQLALTFSLLRGTQKEQLLAFFRERGAWQPFWYSIPFDSLRLWRCPTWGFTVRGWDHFQVTTTFVRDFSPAG